MTEGPETQPSTSSSNQSPSQVSKSDGSESSTGNTTTFPIVYPASAPVLITPHQGHEQINRGPGLYAVPVLPYMQPIVGFPSTTLIPFTYNIPTERTSPGPTEVDREQGQAGDQPRQQQQQAGPQRQVVVRRFQIAIQLDLLLILKLAAVIFLFNQDGSKQRLTVLVFFASLVYLYQTGALTPVIQWLSQGMQRARGNENREQPANENQEGNNRDIGNEHIAGEAEAGNRWWGIAKEIQMIVFGFITSLLPGFHNID